MVVMEKTYLATRFKWIHLVGCFDVAYQSVCLSKSLLLSHSPLLTLSPLFLSVLSGCDATRNRCDSQVFYFFEPQYKLSHFLHGSISTPQFHPCPFPSPIHISSSGRRWPHRHVCHVRRKRARSRARPRWTCAKARGLVG